MSEEKVNGTDRQALMEAMKAETQERVKTCAEQLQKVLDQYDCKIFAFPKIDDDGKIIAQITVLSK